MPLRQGDVEKLIVAGFRCPGAACYSAACLACCATPESVHARVEVTMEKDPFSSSHADTLRAARTLLLQLLPPNTRLTPHDVERLTLGAGLWALTDEVQAREEGLYGSLLPLLPQPPPPRPSKSSPPTPPPAAQATPQDPSLDRWLTPSEIAEVRRRVGGLRQPWSLDETARNGVTQTSYRVYQALLDQAQALHPPKLQMRTYDVQITLGMAYLALPALKERVDGLLKLRYGATGQDRPEAAAVHAVLRQAELPWAGRVTLRETPKQVAMRVSIQFAKALRLAPPAGLNCTIADLHTTLLALYIADKRVRAQIHQLLRDRANVRS